MNPYGRPLADPEAGPRRYRQVVEKALGHPLPLGAVVHHIDGNRQNNRLENLQVCTDEAEHNWVHLQKAAHDACGHEDWRKCYFCKAYDDLKYLKPLRKKGRRVTTFYHPECQKAYKKELKARHDAASNVSTHSGFHNTGLLPSMPAEGFSTVSPALESERA